ncbi:MAG TPA: aminotransferase class I/II-fold pyridoxal phosphate-dependent enzyme, partial [Microbacteriaceae bacterium]|nr:aminotransferase class I/II-fold pyridoxal phosphate-dependent enzyme [Microbacteriaceae bacterium]
VSDAARERSLSVTSASKTFNLAGLKCAQMVAASPAGKRILDELPLEVEWRAALFGAIANEVAFTQADDWLAAVLERLDENRRLLGELLATHLPRAHYRLPEASYLAWVDLSEYPALGENPAAVALAKGNVAFGIGPDFGTGGSHHIRVNFACHPDVLTEAVERLAKLV